MLSSYGLLGTATAGTQDGDIAQLGERCLRKAEAEGSNPFISTMQTSRAALLACAFFYTRTEGPQLLDTSSTFLAYDTCELCPRAVRREETLEKLGFAVLQIRCVLLARLCISGKNRLYRARQGREPSFLAAAPSAVYFAKITKFHKRVLAVRYRLSVLHA